MIEVDPFQRCVFRRLEVPPWSSVMISVSKRPMIVSASALLYMPAIAALRCNPVIRAFSNRLIAAGKHHYVAIAACMRKMLAILNAMLKANQPWKHPTGLDVERSCSGNPGAVH